MLSVMIVIDQTWSNIIFAHLCHIFDFLLSYLDTKNLEIVLILKHI